ncbi:MULTISPECIES: hypothetical protein [Streptomyces]|uniref:Uncharacterized protein n=1 Tax=Streptomyces koelreuteriae TaxID=2838015 RepID=A0ABX8FJ92_9ACTN|nr:MULTISPECIES: hypothetical protein [Streptomyces]QWB21144.1 hypothetical protein KJK29_00355 [Streptomyces koelreuteriae]UUA04057.1 hypothetical protein NNW98_00350 [Streptomyces koelreuteriae]UUA11683.1 hypothetical protein NNW99_00350 [Streptomyces sp. CRCS-T-1]
MHTQTSSRRRQFVRSSMAAALAAGALAVGGLIAAGTVWSGPATAPAGAAKDVGAAPARVAGQWQPTAVPVAKGDLTAVAALSDKQAWSVGYRLKSNTELEAVALKWDGTSWKQQSTLPNGTFPQALAVRSASDIWTVGATAAHWDGASWTTRNLDRDPAGRVTPDAVVTTSDGKAWTAGRAVPQGIKNGVPAIQAWDGTAWRRQTLPDVGKGELTSLTAVAPDDIWAAGTSFATGSTAQTALLLHWDGTSWTRVAAPAGAAGEHRWLSGITALGADDIWAVGGSTSTGADSPYAVHWDGKKWTDAKAPAIADGRLRAVGKAGDGTLWAVGGKGAVSVALRFDAQQRRWEQGADPGVVVRGFTTVPGSANLWTVGIAKQGDLLPAVTRFTG